jgi:hypothetical protein
LTSSTRSWVLAAAVALWIAGPTIRTAAADDFADLCVAGASGLLEAADCSCISQNATDPDDRAALTALFTAYAQAEKTGTEPDESAPEIDKGLQVLNKYVNQCVK